MKPVVALNLLFVKWKYIVKCVIYANPKEADRQRKREWEWYANNKDEIVFCRVLYSYIDMFSLCPCRLI
jgi:hypothetical protein